MATEFNFDCFDTVNYNESSVNNVIKIQALFRGRLIRKQISDVRHIYDEIVQNVDGQEMEVIWKNNKLGRPVVRKCQKMSKFSAIQPVTKVNSRNEVFGNTDIITNAPVPENIQIPSVLNSCEKSGLQMNLKALPCDSNHSSFNQNIKFDSIEVQTGLLVLDDCEKNEMTTADGNMESIQTQGQSSTEAQKDPFKYFTTHNESDVVRNESFSAVDESHMKSLGESLPVLHAAPVVVSECREGEDSESHTAVETMEQGQKEESRKRKEESTLYNLQESKEDLQQIRNTLTMELLWVQQAINSRKHYLRLKQGLQ